MKVWWVAAAIVIGACAGCGTPTMSSTPRACALLTDGDIQGATGSAPATSGGADSSGQSTCAWALGSDGSDSVSLDLVDCTGAGCSGALESAAPAGRWTAVRGIGQEARSGRDSQGQPALAVRTAGSVVIVAVSLSSGDSAAALRKLAGAALSRLP